MSLSVRIFAALLCCFAAGSTLAIDTRRLDNATDQLNKAGKILGGMAEAHRPINQDEEILLGNGITMAVLGASILHRDEAMQHYVNRVGRWIASKSERPDLPWTFGVLDADSVLALAAPGGTVLVSHGLLMLLRNEAELAGVLAHEIAHVVLRHNVRAIQAGKQGIFWSGAGKEAVARQIAKQKSGAQGWKNALARAGVELVKDGVFLRPLDRTLEFEADRVGLTLAAQAGYDPHGLVAALQVLQAATAEDVHASHFLSTHPSATERIAEIEKIGPELLDRIPGKQVEGRYRKFVLERK